MLLYEGVVLGRLLGSGDDGLLLADNLRQADVRRGVLEEYKDKLQ